MTEHRASNLRSTGHRKTCHSWWAKINPKGVPYRVFKGSILRPLLYIPYTSDLPISRDTKMGIFADDTATFATHPDPMAASRNLQEHLNTVENWLKKWKIKVKETKSSHVTSTLRKDNCPSNKHQSNSATTSRICKVPRTTFRLQTKLERAHCQ